MRSGNLLRTLAAACLFAFPAACQPVDAPLPAAPEAAPETAGERLGGPVTGMPVTLAERGAVVDPATGEPAAEPPGTCL
jgi:hypothetical protein